MKTLFLQHRKVSYRFIFNEEIISIDETVQEPEKKISFQTDERMEHVTKHVLEMFAATPSLQRQFAMLKELKTPNNSTSNKVLLIVKTFMPEYVDQIDEICRHLEKKLFPTISSASAQAIGVLKVKN